MQLQEEMDEAESIQAIREEKTDAAAFSEKPRKKDREKMHGSEFSVNLCSFVLNIVRGDAIS